jgi:hypothetical protein
MALIQGQAGVVVVGDGSAGNLRLGRLSDLIVSELHGRYYEGNFRGQLFSGGMSTTAINNATFTSATLGATCTPIAGIWNPAGSNVNAEILQTTLTVILTALTATGGGPFVWAVSAGNPLVNVTTGLKPFNRVTLQQQGSKVFNMAGVALTGLTNNLVVMHDAAIGGGPPTNTAQTYTVAGIPELATAAWDTGGSFIVPPGGVLALLATTTPVALSAASALLWLESQVA